jgi:6-phosphogluconolactonase (cycloisomerase 2 family)
VTKTSVLRVFTAFVLLLLAIAFTGCGGVSSSNSNNPSNPANPGATGTTGPGGSSSPEFLFTSTSFNPQIFAFSVNPATGKLAAVSGSPFADTAFAPRVCSTNCNFHPFILHGDPGGKYLYAIDGTSSALTQYRVGPSGQLTKNGTGGSTATMFVHPSGNFVYTTDFHNLFTFEANPTLTPAPGSPQNPGVQIDSIAGSQNFLYITTNQLSNTSPILGYRIDNSTGALTQVVSQPSPDPNNSAGALVMTPNGQFLYFLGSAGKVFVFRADSGTGALTLEGSQVVFDSIDFVISPNGAFAYSVDEQGTFTTLRIDSNTGALTPINTQTFPGQRLFAIDATGRFAYSIAPTGQPTAANQISVYSIDTSGILHQTDTVTVSVNDTFGSIAMTPTK